MIIGNNRFQTTTKLLLLLSETTVSDCVSVCAWVRRIETTILAKLSGIVKDKYMNCLKFGTHRINNLEHLPVCKKTALNSAENVLFS